MKYSVHLAIIAIFIIQESVFAQLDDGTSMKPILRDALLYIQTIEEKNFEIVRMEYDILNETKSTFRTLHAGWNYGIIAFGDYRILDIDIAIYKEVDGNWILIKEDTDAKSNASVDIKPSSSGLYRIDILGYKFAQGFATGHYGLIIFHE